MRHRPATLRLSPGVTDAGGSSSCDAPAPESPVANLSLGDALQSTPHLLDDEGRPLADGLKCARERKAQTLIVRAFDDEPGCIQHTCLLSGGQGDARAAAQRVLSAAVQLAQAAGIARIRLAMANGERAALDLWRAVCGSVKPVSGASVQPRIRLRRVPPIYPNSHPVLLTQRLLDCEIAPGRSTLSAGAWVVSAAALDELSRRMSGELPPGQVELLVCESDVAVRRCRVAPETTTTSLMATLNIRLVGRRVVSGGWMTGVALAADAPIPATTRLLWVMDDDPPPKQAACIRCGDCVEQCPVGLAPAVEFARPRSSPADEARLKACIGCGLCSHVCPANLPLAEVMFSGAASIQSPGGVTPFQSPSVVPPFQSPNVVPSFRAPGVSRGTGTPQAPVLEEETPGGTGKRTRLPVGIGDGRPNAEGTHSGVPLSVPPAVASRDGAPLADTPPAYVGGSERGGHSGASVEAIVAALWRAMLLPALAGWVFFGPSALMMVAVGLGTALAVDGVISWFRRPGRAERSYAVLQGVIVALLLPVSAPLTAVVIGAALAAGYARSGAAAGGRRLWPPALVGRVMVQFLVGSQFTIASPLNPMPLLMPAHVLFGDVTTAVVYDGPAYQGWTETAIPFTAPGAVRVEPPARTLRRAADGEIDAGGEALLLVLCRDLLPPWDDALIGAVPGPIGATSALAVLVATIFLIRRRLIPWQLPLGVLAGAFFMAAFCPIRGGAGGAYEAFPAGFVEQGTALGLIYLLHHLTAGELLFCGLLVAADPVSSPLTRRGWLWYGLAIGAVTLFMRLYGLLDGEGYWSVLIVSTLVFWIDRRTLPRVRGARA